MNFNLVVYFIMLTITAGSIAFAYKQRQIAYQEAQVRQELLNTFEGYSRTVWGKVDNLYTCKPKRTLRQPIDFINEY